jgi:glycosyltransferase involved in cell wall biosynthesis
MSDSRKSILVITFYDPDCHCGGVEDYIKILYENLSDRGWEVYSLFSIDNKSSIRGNNKLKKYGIQLICPRKKLLNPFRKIEFFLKCSLFVYKNHRRFAIIHSNGDNSFFPFINRKIKRIHWFPGFSIQKVKKSQLGLWKSFLMMLYVAPSTLIELIGLLTSSLSVVDNELLYKWSLRFRRKGLLMIHDAIDTATFHPIKSSLEKVELKKILGLDLEKNYAIWVGTDPSLYRLQETIEAVLAVKNYDLLVVGVNRLINSERIRYLGLIDHSKLADYYKASDIMIHLSRVAGIDLSVLSALASGIPVIVDSLNYSLYKSNEFVYSADDKDQLISILMETSKTFSHYHFIIPLSHLDISFTPDFMVNEYENVLKQL